MVWVVDNDMGNRIEGSASVFTWAHSVHDKIMVLCVGGKGYDAKGKENVL